mgnify:CR=1 FL=1
MHETGAIFAGESSAHYYFRETGNAESQLPVILIVLKVMSREGKTLSEIISALKRSHESGETNFRVKNALEIIEALKISKNATLVTSRFDEKGVRDACTRLGVKLVPKGLAGHVPIFNRRESAVQLVSP